jgi:hypothetical protein
MSVMSNITTFFLTNLGFAVLLAFGLVVDSSRDVHPLYLILLFALCTTPIISIKQLNDRYALLAIFSAVFFMFYGFLDIASLFSNSPGPPAAAGVISKTEIVILLGGILAHVGYRVACHVGGSSTSTSAKDWPEPVLILVGATLWAICTWASWKFRVHIILNATDQATAHGLASMSGIQTAAFMLAVMLQPLGILILAYAQCKYKHRYLTPLLIAVVLVQLAFGFVVDAKGDALIGAVLIVFTKLFVDGRIPKLWLVFLIAFVTVAFPVLQANRWVRNEYGLDHAQVARNIMDTVKKAIAGSERQTTESNRAQTFFERMSLKGSVELIVSNVGRSVPFQKGHTLSPLATSLIPRILWPSKPDVQTGQLMNSEFRVSDAADTYISPTHLGELYWNFGWIGILIGMPLIGLLLGVIGTRCDLSQSVGITRLLIIVVTIRCLILGFEGEIAVKYSVWIRSMLAIGLLHVVFSKALAQRNSRLDVRLGAQNAPSNDLSAQPLFPNLMK